MGTFSFRPYISPLIHVSVWMLLGILLLILNPLTWPVTLPAEFWIRQGFLFGLLVGVFYLNSLVVVPRFLFKNKIGWYIAAVVLSAFALMLFIQMIENWLNLPVLLYYAFNPDGDSPPTSKLFSFNIFVLIFTFLVLGISTSVSVIQKWQKDVQIRQELEKQKISSELSFLKAQINPHFFFNTLNNIYILTTIDVEAARQALHKLSRMMRYVLYETQKDTTLLSQEIAFVQDYIELMQLRLTDKVKVTFEKPNHLADIVIAPMLLLPFVENPFKHGVSATQPSHIHIAIDLKDEQLQLEVKNTLFNGKRVTHEESNGIGLNNTQRRLDLLYPGHYKLLVNEHKEDKEFHVQLTVDLS